MIHAKIKPLPPFETGISLVARLAYLIRPKENLTVSQWAERKIPHYDADALPYLAEIMDALSDPATSQVGDMGPAQGGKSMIGEAWMGWSIDQNPEPFLMVQPDKAAAEAFVKLRINELIKVIPALKQALQIDASADNMHLKLFKGMYLGCAWPVKSQLRQRPYCNTWADDFDAMPDDIEGEGGLLGLLEGRQTTFEGRDTQLVSSSPAKDDQGIEFYVEGGTDERLQPICPSCNDRIELNIRRDLKFDSTSAKEAELTAHVVCPANGCILHSDAKRKLLDSCKILPNRGFVAKNPNAGSFRRTFRRDGLLAFTSWGKLARQWFEADQAWRKRQDESLLKAFFNVKGGQNYRSQLIGEKPLDPNDLKARRESGWRLDTVPRGPKVLNAVVDAQADRFEVAIIGTAAARETWVISRYAIEVLDDGLTGIQPFTHKEHWKVLLPLFDKKLPLVDKDNVFGHAPILSVAVDTGGSSKQGDQATEGAKFFYEAAVAQGVHPKRITLLKGGSKPKGQLMPRGQFADQKLRGGAKRRSAQLWIPNVHKIKNMIDARLRREEFGPGYIHLPENLSEEYIDEILAEEMVDGKWKKRRARNETWDHLVYSEAALLKPPFAQSQNHMRWIPRGFSIIWPTSSEGKAVKPIKVKTEKAAKTTSQKKARASSSRQSNDWIGVTDNWIR